MARGYPDYDFPAQRFHLKERKHINIQLINGDNMVLSFDKTTRLSELFEAVCKHVQINERDLFGLAVAMDDLFLFLDMNAKVSKINFKSIRKKSSTLQHHELIRTPNSSTDPTVHFRVQFYVRCHTLRERFTKHLYYQQLKSNFLTFKVLCPTELLFQLAALALQADFGPFNPTKHGGSSGEYFDPKQYLPPWIVSQFGEAYIKGNLPGLHRQHYRLSRTEAEFQFIRLSSNPPNSFNMHLCPLLELRTGGGTVFERRRGSSTGPGGGGEPPLWIGLSPAGIELHKERPEDGFLSQMSTLVWSQIVQLTYKKRKFIVQVIGGRTLLLEATNCTQAEHLFWLCQRMHRYQTTAKLGALHSQEAIEGHERRHFRESYVYSDHDDLESRRRCDSNASSLQRQMWAGHLRDSADPYGYNSLPGNRRSVQHVADGAGTVGRVSTAADSSLSRQIAEDAAVAMVTKEREQRVELPKLRVRHEEKEKLQEQHHPQTQLKRHSLDVIELDNAAPLSPVSPPSGFADSLVSLDYSSSSGVVLPPPPQFRSDSPPHHAAPPPRLPLSTSSPQQTQRPSLYAKNRSPGLQRPLNNNTIPSNGITSFPQETDMDDLSPLATNRSFSSSDEDLSMGEIVTSGETQQTEKISVSRDNRNWAYLSGGSSQEDASLGEMVVRQQPTALSSSSLTKKAVSLDQVDQTTANAILNRELSRSFPLLANLCHEFNRPEILREGRNINTGGVAIAATTPSYHASGNTVGGRGLKSWQSEALHLDQVGHEAQPSNVTHSDYDDSDSDVDAIVAPRAFANTVKSAASYQKVDPSLVGVPIHLTDSLQSHLSDLPGPQYSHDRAGHSYVNMGSNPMLSTRTSCA